MGQAPSDRGVFIDWTLPGDETWHVAPGSSAIVQVKGDRPGGARIDIEGTLFEEGAEPELLATIHAAQPMIYLPWVPISIRPRLVNADPDTQLTVRILFPPRRP